MYALIGLLWILCSIFMATKWFNKSEKQNMRFGSAMRRLIFSIWDWCLYLILSLIILAIPFIGILLFLAQWGWLIQIIGVIIVIVLGYRVIAHRK